MKRILSILAVTALLFCLILPANAAEDGLELLFEEDFEEYENGVNVNSTKLPELFVCEYNSIGDGIICVNEGKGGELRLLSHVFTQIYIGTPVIGAYEFSLDVSEAHGNVQSGIFVRAPKTDAAYYEGDGYPDTSTCLSGLFITPHTSSIGVNVKTFNKDAASTSYLDNNLIKFDLPDGVKFPYTLRVTDDGERINLFCNDTKICTVAVSEPGRIYVEHQATDPCFGAAVVYDGAGNELASLHDTLLQSDGSVIGWATRAANLEVDNIKIKTGRVYKTLLAVAKIPVKITEKNAADAADLAKTARGLYDSLSDADRALITNVERLTKAEAAVAELIPETTVTDPPATEPPQTDTTTDGITAAPDAQTADTAEEAAGTEYTDDSLVVWILIAVMLAMAGAAAGFIVLKVRK